MGTYDYAIGNTSPSWREYGKVVVLERVMNAADIIASNATLTAAAKITAADIIQAINVPAGFVLLSVGVNVTVAGTAANTVDIGLAGGQEAFAGLDIVTTGYSVNAVNVAWGADNAFKVFAADDTIDVQYIADEVTGSFTLKVVGYML